MANSSFEFTRAITRRPGRSVTAGLRAGANAYLMKPIDPPLLLREIGKYLERTGEA